MYGSLSSFIYFSSIINILYTIATHCKHYAGIMDTSRPYIYRHTSSYKHAGHILHRNTQHDNTCTSFLFLSFCAVCLRCFALPSLLFTDFNFRSKQQCRRVNTLFLLLCTFLVMLMAPSPHLKVSRFSTRGVKDEEITVEEREGKIDTSGKLSNCYSFRSTT